ncbi:DNA methylase N-4/N-6 domain protein [Hippea maritima DSM 10411]|uniref:Methyltransferase n=2 Tax=Hippea TaxID=84404 RepID=F2LTX9_HIPMA|nr:DNA methylase N-4/N-6 domain protein [Hippea maritima DSM 10411]
MQKKKHIQETLFKEKSRAFSNRSIIINKSKFLEILDNLIRIQNIQELKIKLKELKSNLTSTNKDKIGILNIDKNGDTIEIKYNYLINELTQIEETLTLERTRYYINRLKKALTEIKTNKINDINLNRWKEYDEIITDSLWIFDKRDTSGAHHAWYWGNFIPQIPHQLMLRYTKKGDWVLDPLVGSGTTLIECRRLGRNGIGIEINPDVVEKAKKLIEKEPNRFNVTTDIITGDSTQIDLKKILEEKNVKKIQLVIIHPPYHDIIKFSNNPDDLSNAKTVDKFLEMFGKVLDNVLPVLEEGRYLGIVIGDKYSKGEWIPLGFYVMNEVLKREKFVLKSIIVKNFEETRAKRNQKELWRYRALVGGFYVFKHEYVLIFKKRG